MLSTNKRARKAPESSRFGIAIYTAMVARKALIINKANRMLLNSLPLLLVSSGYRCTNTLSSKYLYSGNIWKPIK